MTKANPITIAVNVAGISALLVVGGYAAHSMLADEKTPVCTTSYPSPTRVSLVTENGAPMSPSELQGQLGRDEWGILDHVEVVRGSEERGSEVLQIKLPAGTSSAHQDIVPRGGTGFNWVPDSIKEATGACLTYRIMVPEDFEFSKGGMLPGLYGGTQIIVGKKSEEKSGFATRVLWGQEGTLSLGTLAPVNGNRVLDNSKLKLTPGKWHEITTEAVLNTPGANNGIVRLWVDGELATERMDLALRSAEQPFTVTGVLTDVSYGHFTDPVAAPKDTHIQISPFELRWQ